MSQRLVFAAAALACVLVLGPASGSAPAGVYPGNKCVSGKLKEAGKKCKGLLKAWATWDKSQDTTKRDDALANVATKFEDKWTKADTKAAAQGVDCEDTTASAAAAEATIDAGVAAIVAEVNAGLDLVGTPADGQCGAKLLQEAAKKCDGLLKSYSKFIKSPAKDASKAKLGDQNAKVVTKFAEKFQAVLDDGCPTTATTASVEALVDQLRDDLIASTTISPNVSDTAFDVFTIPTFGAGHEIEYEGRVLRPSCLTLKNGTFEPFSFFAKRGANGQENNLFVHFEGGGACWDFSSCFLAETTDTDAQVFGDCVANVCENGSPLSNGNACVDDSDCLGNDNPNQFLDAQAPGFFDLTDVRNPFKDWSVLFIPTCAGDVFSGDAADQSYCAGPDCRPVRHRGFQNAKVAEKWVREHFLDPDKVVVSGLSAGSAGLPLHQYFYQFLYPAAEKTVLYDSFVVIATQAFLDGPFQHWDAIKNFPAGLEIAAPTNELLHIANANMFPDTTYAHLTNAFDGPGGQGGFYHVMKNLGDLFAWANWWESICEWNGHLTDQLAATAAGVTNDNYRYYVAAGSVHGTFPSDRIYTDTTGAVPVLSDWVSDLIDRSTPLPANVQASPDNVLIDSGDPQPSPLECPFEMSGPDVVINCTSCTP